MSFLLPKRDEIPKLNKSASECAATSSDDGDCALCDVSQTHGILRIIRLRWRMHPPGLPCAMARRYHPIGWPLLCPALQTCSPSSTERLRAPAVAPLQGLAVQLHSIIIILRNTSMSSLANHKQTVNWVFFWCCGAALTPPAAACHTIPPAAAHPQQQQ
jgi:hypothetical protein